MNKKILITGGSGFIGKNLQSSLAERYDLVAPTSGELNLLDADAVKQFLEKGMFDAVIHCATHDAARNSKKDESMTLENNLRMFFNLTRCNHLYGRMFYFGSGAEYDKTNYIPNMNEEYFDKHVPKNQYGFSKYVMAKYICILDNVIDLRIFGCFGKYEDWEIRFISNAICKAMYGMDITIKQNVYFDYMYVQDLATIMDWFIRRECLAYKHYNVCTSTRIDLVTLAKKIVEISGKKLGINVCEPGLKPEYTGDNRRLLGEMGVFKFTKVDHAIEELYDWYMQRKSDIDKNLLLTDK